MWLYFKNHHTYIGIDVSCFTAGIARHGMYRPFNSYQPQQIIILTVYYVAWGGHQLFRGMCFDKIIFRFPSRESSS